MGFKLPGKSIQTGTSGHSSALKMVTEQKAASALKAKTYDQAYADMKYDPDENADAKTIYRKKDKYGRVYGADNTETEDKGRAEFTKAAKAWNMKTYGTHNPTADAKKAGMTKKELAAKHKASKTTTTTTTTKDKTTTDPVKEETKPRVEKTKDKYVVVDKTRTVRRKDGTVKKYVRKGREIGSDGEYKYKDKTTYRKDGSEKKEVSKSKEMDNEGKFKVKNKATYRKDGSKKKEVSKGKDTGYYDESKGKTKTKYDKEGNVKRSKNVDVREGRRTVTKTNKKGETKTRSRRTLKGILTGKGKKKKEETE